MSRIGKKPILIPQDVKIKVDGQRVAVKGPKGELSREIRPEIRINLSEKEISFSPCAETKETPKFWGLSRALVNNLIEGVTKGFEKKLEIEGVGYKFISKGEKSVELSVGYSHNVPVNAPEGITFAVEKNTITVSGIDKEKVFQCAANIRKIKPPEPYKGKGIKYVGEIIRRKSGKKVAATENK
ncbi:50S ribosomal protein L6 [Candidatus Parcubacteria bacterium A4]|nr:MAG: 50S ribosomal protein L6 [Candidatus Parcubacteria bacterium A4]